MQLVISPAKSLDFETPVSHKDFSNFRLTQEAQELVIKLQSFSPYKLSALMKISSNLSELNYHRFMSWKFPFNSDDAKQALFAFKGAVYAGLDAYSLSKSEMDYTQDTLRILSGLYGILRPLDLILPYRLEMGTALKLGKSNNLYSFWGRKITHLLNQDIKENNHKVLINLASNEYFKSLQLKSIHVPIITPTFKDLKNGEYKMISVYAKKARGLMTRFIIQNRIEDYQDLRAFDLDGYYFNNQLSTDQKPVFTRDY